MFLQNAPHIIPSDSCIQNYIKRFSAISPIQSTKTKETISAIVHSKFYFPFSVSFHSKVQTSNKYMRQFICSVGLFSLWNEIQYTYSHFTDRNHKDLVNHSEIIKKLRSVNVRWKSDVIYTVNF